MINPTNFILPEIPQHHPKSYQYKDFWKQQKDYCINGMTIGGKWMPGPLYFYLNFGTIIRMDAKTGRKSKGRPFLRDVDWEYALTVEQARKERKGVILIAGRRVGKSYYGANLINWEYTFFRDNEMVVGAYESKYSDKFMSMVQDHMEGLRGTPFYHQRIKDVPRTELRSGYQIKTRTGYETQGLNSRVYNINFAKAHDAANGKMASLFVFEEIGLFTNLLQAYASAEPCWKEGSTWYGMPLLMGTGGDMEGGGSVAAQRMFYDPDTFNLLSFEDHENHQRFGLFIPGWKCLNDFKRVFSKKEGGDGETMMTLEEGAKEQIAITRAKKQKNPDKTVYYKEIQYYPNTPYEAFLQSTANRFPTALLQQQRTRLLSGNKLKYAGRHGWMVQHGQQIKFELDPQAQEAPWPMKQEARKGCVTLWEDPYVNEQGDIPYGMYLACYDPYRHEGETDSDSLGTCFVYKKFHALDEDYDILVAEYTGREDRMEDHHEQVYLLCQHFNARNMFENEVPGIKVYYQQRHSLHMLCDQPTSIIKSVSPNSKVAREKGCHLSVQMKLETQRWLADWLMTPRGKDDDEQPIYNLHYIKSLHLLNELINHNAAMNFDRVSALQMLMVHIKSVEHLAVGEDEITNNSQMADELRALAFA